MKKLIVLIVFMLSMDVGSSYAADRYITPAGANSNDGMSRATSFSGIQLAINIAQTGDTLYIGTGTYLQSGTITKPLTIRGMGTGNTILDGVLYPVNTAGLTINGGVNNFTISDISITRFYRGINRNSTVANQNWLLQNISTTDNADIGIFIRGAGEVRTMQFIGIQSNYNNRTAIGRGILFQGMDRHNITIQDGMFIGNRIAGIDFNTNSTNDGQTSTNITIVGNIAGGDNIANGYSDSAIAVLGVLPDAGGSSRIANNTIFVYGRYGIEIKNVVGNTQSAGNGSFVVENNTITKIGPAVTPTGTPELRDIAGIAVLERTVVLATPAPTSGVVIRNNTVSGFIQNNGGSVSEGFGIVAGGQMHSILNNTLSNNQIALQTQAGHNQDQSNLPDRFFGRDKSTLGNDIIVSGNIIYATNTIGFRQVNIATPGNVQYNYREGCDPSLTVQSRGPATGTVTYSPFYVTDTLSALSYTLTGVSFGGITLVPSGINVYGTVMTHNACPATGTFFITQGLNTYTGTLAISPSNNGRTLTGAVGVIPGDFIYTITFSGVAGSGIYTGMYNVPVIPPVINNGGGGGGGGGGGSVGLTKDNCPNGDFSQSYYDKTCGIQGELGSDLPLTQTSSTNIIDRIDDMINTFTFIKNQCATTFPEYGNIFFTDTIGHPFATQINTLLSYCAVKGVSKNTFGVEKNMTRAEIIKVIVNTILINNTKQVLQDNSPTNPDTIQYTDVQDNDRFVPYMVQAYQRGLLKDLEQQTSAGLRIQPNALISAPEAIALIKDAAQFVGRENIQVTFSERGSILRPKVVEAVVRIFGLQGNENFLVASSNNLKFLKAIQNYIRGKTEAEQIAFLEKIYTLFTNVDASLYKIDKASFLKALDTLLQ